MHIYPKRLRLFASLEQEKASFPKSRRIMQKRKLLAVKCLLSGAVLFGFGKFFGTARGGAGSRVLSGVIGGVKQGELIFVFPICCRRTGKLFFEAVAERCGIAETTGIGDFGNGERGGVEEAYGNAKPEGQQVVLRRGLAAADKKAVEVRAVDTDVSGDFTDLYIIAVVVLYVFDGGADIICIAFRTFLPVRHVGKAEIQAAEQGVFVMGRGGVIKNKVEQRLLKPAAALVAKNGFVAAESAVCEDFADFASVEADPAIFPRLFIISLVKSGFSGAN